MHNRWYFGVVMGLFFAQAFTPMFAQYTVYLCDRDLGRVLQFAPQDLTNFTIFIPAGSNGLRLPYGGDFDSAGHFYVSDVLNNRVMVFDSNGVYLSVFPTSPGTSPSDLAIGPDGNVYVACQNGRVEKFTSAGASLGTFAIVSGTYGVGWNREGGNDYLYVTSLGGFINKYTSNGSLVMTFNMPNGLRANDIAFRNEQTAVVTLSQWSYTGYGEVGQFDTGTGNYLGRFDQIPDLNWPQGIAVAPDSTVYVVEYHSGSAMFKLDSTGQTIAAYVPVPYTKLVYPVVKSARCRHCPDTNGDGVVDDSDLLAVLFAFGVAGTDMPEDVDCSGTVDDSDLLAVLFAFGGGGC